MTDSNFKRRRKYNYYKERRFDKMKKLNHFVLVFILLTVCFFMFSQKRVLADGVSLWGDGTQLSPTAVIANGMIIPDNHGGTIVTIPTYSATWQLSLDIYRVASDGNIAWSKTITTSSGFVSGFGIAFNMVSDKKGGAIIFWQNDSSGISAQHVDMNGNLLWRQDGISVCQYCWPYDYASMYVASDGYGGAIITYVNNYPIHIHAQRIGESGNFLWGENGVDIKSSAFLHHTLTVDDQGGAIITWVESKGWVDPWSIMSFSIKAQRIDPSGHILWQEGGLEAAAFAAAYTHGIVSPLAIISDGSQGAIISWSYIITPEDPNISILSAQRIDSSGNPMWQKDGLEIGKRKDYYFSPPAVSDGIGGIIISWIDPSDQVYVQRVDINGKIKWGEGKVIGTRCAGCSQITNAIGGTAAKGIFAAWIGIGKGFFCTDTLGINIQRLDNDGNILWPYSMVIPGWWYGNAFPPLSAENNEAFIFYDNNGLRVQKIVETGPLDTDGDGIPDKTDKCPCENSQDKDANKDGCTDTACGLADVVRSVGITNKGIENSLVSLAENACKQATEGKNIPAKNMIAAFANEVNVQKDKAIGTSTANMLINYAQNIISNL